jgi:hypothetical protein
MSSSSNTAVTAAVGAALTSTNQQFVERTAR